MTNFPGTRQQPGEWQGAPCPSIRAESPSVIRQMAMKTRVSGQPRTAQDSRCGNGGCRGILI